MVRKRMYVGIAFIVLGITGYAVDNYYKYVIEGQETTNYVATDTVQAIPVTKMEKIIRVDIVNEKGEKIGTSKLKEEADGVRIFVQVTKLTPGKHGIHIHEAAFKDVDFESAGSHFNPYYKHHGLDNPKGPHIGDMPNLTVREDGTGELEYLLSQTTLTVNKQNSLLGRSIIIHEKEDDQKSNPSGNSGMRIAGGVIIAP